MFIINLNYIVPLEKLDAHMTDHVKFLKKYYKKNVFVVQVAKYLAQEASFSHWRNQKRKYPFNK